MLMVYLKILCHTIIDTSSDGPVSIYETGYMRKFSKVSLGEDRFSKKITCINIAEWLFKYTYMYGILLIKGISLH